MKVTQYYNQNSLDNNNLNRKQQPNSILIMQNQDRPLKPNKQYLQQCQTKQNEKLHHAKQYLKKNTNEQLACFRHQPLQKHNSNRNKQPTKTKAQIYQQIKVKNREKFGDWKKKYVGEVEDQKKRKIEGKNMTVEYRHKEINKQIKIDIQQYKKQGYVPKNKPQKQDPEKLQYDKMVEYLKKCYTQFQKQREQFNSQKQYLKFKKAISSEQPLKLNISSKIPAPSKNKANSLKNKQNFSNKNIHFQENVSINSQEQEEPQCLFRYTIQKIHECSPFTLRELCNFTPLQQFYFENNALYMEAQDILENYRSEAQVSEIGEKRYTKFREGWYQAWLPGKHRTAYNKQKDYKVTWYGNGDIRQQYNKTTTYYSKKNRVNEIKVQGKDPILFFPQIWQLQMHMEKGKEIRFSDGRFQFVSK